MIQLRGNRKECRKNTNLSIVKMKHSFKLFHIQCLFLVLDKSLHYKKETSHCNIVTVLNSMPREMYRTGRRVKQRALQGMNAISSAAVWALFVFSVSFFLSSAFIPTFLFQPTCSVYSAVSFTRVITNSPSLAVTQCIFTVTARCWSSPCSSLFQIISLLNVFTPQKSLEEFQDVWVY